MIVEREEHMLSRKANIRLNKLIRFMHKLPAAAEDHFKMGWWCGHEAGGDVEHDHFDPSKPITRRKIMTCGTSACAFGWATAVPSFQKLGLKMYVKPDGVTFSFRGDRTTGRVEESSDPIRLASAFFDIDYVKAAVLFGGSQGHITGRALTPKEWAEGAKFYVDSWDDGW